MASQILCAALTSIVFAIRVLKIARRTNGGTIGSDKTHKGTMRILWGTKRP